MELKIKSELIFKEIEEERERKMSSLCSDSSITEKQFLTLLDRFQRKEEIISRALKYAKTLDFSKNSLKSSYLSHPLRLTSYLLLMEPGIHADYIVTALLHNVPETTETTSEELKKLFNEQIGENIETLVVDRKVPFDSIKRAYYNLLFSKGQSLVLIKLIDKLDNLFVLCLNPDDAIRKNYLDEIKEELLPFAFEYNNELGIYLEKLLHETEAIGFSPELKKQLTDYQQSISK